MTQHSALSPERWARFTLDQQILQIAAEMHRSSRLMAPADLRALLQMRSEAARQIPYLLGE